MQFSFFQFYHLASVRMQELCYQLDIRDMELKRKIWTCFEHSIIQHTDLMQDRHLDQIIMCSVYVICKVNTFLYIVNEDANICGEVGAGCHCCYTNYLHLGHTSCLHFLLLLLHATEGIFQNMLWPLVVTSLHVNYLLSFIISFDAT